MGPLRAPRDRSRMHGVMVSAIIIAASCQLSAGCACTTVSVTLGGAAYTSQSGKAGDFVIVQGVTSGERPLYRSPSDKYLYYWPARAEWLISSSSYTTGSSGVRSTSGDGTACPEDASSWEYWDGQSFASSTEVYVSCPSPPSPPCACDTVSVALHGSALALEPSRVGQYTRVLGLTSGGGRPVYQKAGDYLSFRAEHADWLIQDWRSFLSSTASSVRGASDGNAECPELTSAWEVLDGDTFVLSGDILVTCPTPPLPPWPPGSAPPAPPLPSQVECAPSADGSEYVCSNHDPFFSASLALVPLQSCAGRSMNPACYVDSSCSTPVVIGPNQVVVVVRMSDGGRLCGFSFAYQMGPAAAEPDGALYDLPFVGTSRVVQGYHGEGFPSGCPSASHCDHDGDSSPQDLAYAIDFGMAMGAPIAAAREGVVTRVVSGHGLGGSCFLEGVPFDRAQFAHADESNLVHVLHSDGTLAVYSHLNQTNVTVGEAVARRQLLGTNGMSGCAASPHLHFQVFASGTPQAWDISLPSDVLSGASWSPSTYRLRTKSVPIQFAYACQSEPLTARFGMVIRGVGATTMDCPGPSSTSICAACSLPEGSADATGCTDIATGAFQSLIEVCCRNAESAVVRVELTSLMGRILGEVPGRAAFIEPGTARVMAVLSSQQQVSYAYSWSTSTPDAATACTSGSTTWTSDRWHDPLSVPPSPPPGGGGAGGAPSQASSPPTAPPPAQKWLTIRLTATGSPEDFGVAQRTLILSSLSAAAGLGASAPPGSSEHSVLVENTHSRSQP